LSASTAATTRASAAAGIALVQIVRLFGRWSGHPAPAFLRRRCASLPAAAGDIAADEVALE
jgi:hypothetical protein